jgi:lysophospholipase L1-like esterase
VAQKMGMHRREFSNRRFYFDEAVEICKKWGIPYLDLWNCCYLNPQIDSMYDPGKSPEENRDENVCFYIDGQHLTSRGYDFTAETVENWIKSL